MRTLRIIALLLFPLTILAQPHEYRYELELMDQKRELHGKMQLRFKNQSGKTLNSFYLHLPPRSLEWKSSSLNEQISELQDVSLYFGDTSISGAIQTGLLTVGNKEYEICLECEFVEVKLDAPLEVNEEIDVSMAFEIRFGSIKYNGVGFEDGVYRFTNWLPRAAMVDSTGWHLNPSMQQHDFYQSFDQWQVSLKVPNQFTVASNASLTSDDELRTLKDRMDNPYRKYTAPEGTKLLEFAHVGTELQFIFSRDFYVFPFGQTNKLYTSDPDPYLPSVLNSQHEIVSNYFKEELGSEMPLNQYDLVVLEDKKGEYQSDHLLSIEKPKGTFELSRDLLHARAEMLFRYRINPNGIKHPWLARGIPYFYKYTFVQKKYPEKKWLPFSNSLLGKLFSLDQFDYGYQNQFLYMFLARQGLDQPISTPADSLTRLNYEAAIQAKTYLALSHLREYISEPNFKRSLRDFSRENIGKHPGPSELEGKLRFYFNRDLDWFNRWIHSAGKYDYQLWSTDHCPTVSTATIKNKGDLALPFSITGIKDGKAVLTEWHEGFTGTKTLQTYHDEFDEVVINIHQTTPEYNQRDNKMRTKGLFKRAEPLKLQFYNSFENPNTTQLYWVPSADFNAYDKLLLGVSVYNETFVNKKFEYTIGPEYSTGTQSLTGFGSLVYNYIPKPSSIFHRVVGGTYFRYNHYAEDLAYFRFSPSVKFYIRKPYPRSPLIELARLRMVRVDRELPNTYEGLANEVTNASYSIFNASYSRENTNTFHPSTITADFQLGDNFSKIGLTGDFRWMLRNKKWLIWRNFFAYVFSNDFADIGINGNYYSPGLSGTLDYMFDYDFIGRSDSVGIWSQQFFVTDGGFKTSTGVFAEQWLWTTNLSLPIYSVFGVFGDIGFSDNFDNVYWDYGIRISILTDFLEFYFPIANHDRHFINEHAYIEQVRFILDLDISNIVGRLRRGYF